MGLAVYNITVAIEAGILVAIGAGVWMLTRRRKGKAQPKAPHH